MSDAVAEFNHLKEQSMKVFEVGGPRPGLRLENEFPTNARKGGPIT